MPDQTSLVLLWEAATVLRKPGGSAIAWTRALALSGNAAPVGYTGAMADSTRQKKSAADKYFGFVSIVSKICIKYLVSSSKTGASDTYCKKR